MNRRVAIVLMVLTALFFARVAGQALVAFGGVSWLPPMKAWYSGLLPYPLLLPTQILILGGQLVIDRGVWRGGGVFASAHPRLGRALRGFSYVYAVAMLVRWIVTHSHGIPIVFHWVLAAYLFTLGHFLGASALTTRSGLRRRRRRRLHRVRLHPQSDPGFLDRHELVEPDAEGAEESASGAGDRDDAPALVDQRSAAAASMNRRVALDQPSSLLDAHSANNAARHRSLLTQG
jgi:hypothetical protein